MFPIDPPRFRPPPVEGSKIKIAPINPVGPKKHEEESTSLERRRKNDRRKAPFRHRGQFEMRSGVDRRDQPHVDEEV